MRIDSLVEKIIQSSLFKDQLSRAYYTAKQWLSQFAQFCFLLYFLHSQLSSVGPLFIQLFFHASNQQKIRKNAENYEKETKKKSQSSM